MHVPSYFTAFNTKAALLHSRLLPGKINQNKYPLTCGNCKFVNPIDHHFCINCGFPIFPNKDTLTIYSIRLKRRKAIELSCSVRILQARNALYILATLLMFGLFYIFSAGKESVIRGTVMLVLGVIYAGLGRWSVFKPFTSFLIGLMLMLTFAAISTWAQFYEKEATSYALYTIFIQVIFIYFLWQGVKGAFHADILEEETKL